MRLLKKINRESENCELENKNWHSDAELAFSNAIMDKFISLSENLSSSYILSTATTEQELDESIYARIPNFKFEKILLSVYYLFLFVFVYYFKLKISKKICLR